MSAWRRAIPREPRDDTDSIVSGLVFTPINLGQPVGHRTPNVVASTTIQEKSLDKAGASRDIVKPHGSSEGPRGKAVATAGAQRRAVTGTLGEVTEKSVPKGLRARHRMKRILSLRHSGLRTLLTNSKRNLVDEKGCFSRLGW